MRNLAIVCYSIGALAEITGIVLVVGQLLAARRKLKDWNLLNPSGGQGLSWGQIEAGNAPVQDLYRTGWRGLAGAIFLVIGVVGGTLGDFASLPGS